jgi:hypothetical protein
MIDEDKLRSILSEVIERYIPQLRQDKVRLTVPECCRRYRRSHRFVTDLIRRGELEASFLESGRNGRPQYLIKTDSAERHPKLGGQA